MATDEGPEQLETESPGLMGKVKGLRQTLLGAFGVMVIAATLAGILNYLFAMIMTRMLNQVGAFSDFNSLNSIFLMVMLASASVQAVIAKYIAQYDALGERDKIAVLLRSFSKWLLWTGAVVMVVSVAAAWPLARAMHLGEHVVNNVKTVDGFAPLFVIILGTSIAASLYITLPYGFLQGEQKFLGLGGAMMSAATLRIVLGVAMVAIGFGVYGAIGAATVSVGLVAFAVVYRYREMFRGKIVPIEGFQPGHALWFLLPVAIATFFLIFMTQIDVVLVKALLGAAKTFPPFKNGQQAADAYSYGALAGKAVLFFPEGIVVVMFPRVAALRAQGKPTRRVLAWSLAAVTAMVVAVAGFYTLFPTFTAKVFAGGKGEIIQNLEGPMGLKFVSLFGIVMAVFAIVRLLTFYHLALERKAFIAVLGLGAVAEVIGIALFHRSLTDVLIVMLVVGLVLLVVNVVLAFFEKPPVDAGPVEDEEFSAIAEMPIT